MSFILLEQQKIFFTDIPKIYDRSNFSNYSNQILDFCLAWINNDNTFEISTSGSTGAPQKIVWTRELMLWSIKNTAQVLLLKKGMHCLLCIDADKAGGKMMLARALELEMSIEIVEPSAYPFKNSRSTYFDFAAMVPFQIHHLFSENKIHELNNIGTLIIGGAPLHPSLIEALQTLSAKIYATYGMTETASHIALQRVNGREKEDYFRHFEDVQIGVDDVGCAVISTPFHHQLHTNDLLQINPDGTFMILGRYDNIINSGGYKISLEKVEAALDKTLTSLKLNFFNYCAFKQPDDKLGEALIVIFETSPLDDKTKAEITQELKNHLFPYEIPKHFYFIPKLVYTSSGKIDRTKSYLLLSN